MKVGGAGRQGKQRGEQGGVSSRLPENYFFRNFLKIMMREKGGGSSRLPENSFENLFENLKLISWG